MQTFRPELIIPLKENPKPKQEKNLHHRKRNIDY